MLWHKRQQYGDKAWVFLLLKPDILWECDCAFYPTNAASAGLRHEPVENFKTADAFESMFAREVIKETTTNGVDPITRSPDLKRFLPTDVQAEVLVFNTITPNYIIKCLHHSGLNMDLLIKRYPNITFSSITEQHRFYGFR